MSGLIVGLVLRTPITDLFNSDAKFIATVYADHAWEDGSHAYPAVSTVATITGLSERTVQRYLRILEGIGMLVVNGKGPRGTNRYDFPLVQSNDGAVRLDLRGGVTVTPPIDEEKPADSGDTVTPRQAVGGDTESGDTELGDSIVSPKQTTRHLKPYEEEEENAPKFKIAQTLQDALKELGIYVSVWKDVEKRIAEGWSEADIIAVIIWMLKTCKDKTKAAQRFVTRVREGTKAPKEYYPKQMPSVEQNDDDLETDEILHVMQADSTVTDSVRLAWGLVVRQMQGGMRKSDFEKYLQDTEPVHSEPGVLVIGAHNSEGTSWLYSRIQSVVERLLIGIMNEAVEVRFVVAESVAVETEVV